MRQRKEKYKKRKLNKKKEYNDYISCVSAEHVAAINKSIEKKLKKNNRERKESEKEAGKYIVR